MAKARPLRINTRIVQTKYKNRLLKGEGTDPLIERHGAPAILEAMRAIEQAVASALKENRDNFRHATLTALRYRAGRKVSASIGTIQHGTDQAVCSVNAQAPRAQVIVKGAFPHHLTSYTEHPFEHLFAFEDANFTTREFKGLQAATLFSEQAGQVIDPIALVPSHRGTTLYSQPHAPEGFFELNPTFTRRRWTFFYNEPSGAARAHIDNRIESDGAITVLLQTIKLMTTVLLRSQAAGHAMLMLPSFPAGDIMVNRNHEIRVVGLRNVFSFDKLIKDYQRLEQVPGSPERVLCRYLDRIYAMSVLGLPGVSLSRAGFTGGLVFGLLDGYDQFHGGRSNHRLNSDLINRYINEATPGQ